RPRPIATSRARARAAAIGRSCRIHRSTNADGGSPTGSRAIIDRILAQALLTAVGLGLLGLIATAIVGLAGADITRHITFGIFATMVTLLGHSMMMFYLIGKGKAVKDAMV